MKHALSKQTIEATVHAMDKLYDANFGDWIRNEENCKIIGANMRRYLSAYRESEFITVVKWIVRDWTLKSIILFTRRLLMVETPQTDQFDAQSGDLGIRTVKILSGFIYTWNPVFIAEFLLSVTASYTSDERASLIVDVLGAFEPRKLSEILSLLQTKADESLRRSLTVRTKSGVYGIGHEKWDRTQSLIDAFNT